MDLALGDIQKDKALLSALIKAAPFQTTTVTINAAVIQPFLFVGMDMSQSKIIDILAPQHR